MGLTDLLKDVGRALTLTAALYSCGGDDKQGCQDDYDCREPRVCVRGYCEGGDSGDENNGSKVFSCQDVYDICLRYFGEREKRLNQKSHSQEAAEGTLMYCQSNCDEYSSISNQPNYNCATIACFVEENTCSDKTLSDRNCLEMNGWDCERDSPNSGSCR